MACYRPLKGYRARITNESGKRSIVFDKKLGFEDQPVTLPCGACIGCRLERSRQWAIRCIHEAALTDNNCFITLTYNDRHLPLDRSVNVRDFQLFMKRYRKRFGNNIRYFHCGEYGDEMLRPHYHAIIFNHDFDDKVPWKKNPNGDLVYVSASLTELWSLEGQPIGFSSLGAVTFQSAAYVARYIMKKVTGDKAGAHYEWIDPLTGEIHRRKPEYVTMSRNGGIGKEWLKNWKGDVYPHDYVVVNGKRCGVPRFYDSQLTEKERKRFKATRKIKAKKRSEDNTPDRLKVREKVCEARVAALPRNLTTSQE